MSSDEKITEIIIYDMSGKMHHVPNSSEGNENILVNTSGLSAGFYLVRIQSAGTVKTSKLTIERD
jgi:hypothetical protein